jgi:hypothetical protein
VSKIHLSVAGTRQKALSRFGTVKVFWGREIGLAVYRYKGYIRIKWLVQTAINQIRNSGKQLPVLHVQFHNGFLGGRL